MNYIRR